METGHKEELQLTCSPFSPFNTRPPCCSRRETVLWGITGMILPNGDLRNRPFVWWVGAADAGASGPCYPTLRQKEGEGWGTHFSWWARSTRSNRRSFDSVWPASGPNFTQDDKVGEWLCCAGLYCGELTEVSSPVPKCGGPGAPGFDAGLGVVLSHPCRKKRRAKDGALNSVVSREWRVEGSCYPTQAKLGWGTHFSWWARSTRSNRRSFDSVWPASGPNFTQDDKRILWIRTFEARS